MFLFNGCRLSLTLCRFSQVYTIIQPVILSFCFVIIVCDCNCLCTCFTHSITLFRAMGLQWGTVDAEFTVPSAANSELQMVLSSKPGVGQNTALPASPAAVNSACLFFYFCVFTFFVFVLALYLSLAGNSHRLTWVSIQ